MDVKDILKNRRLEKQLTLDDVARLVGVSGATISRWESGDIANMRRDKIAKLASALDISPAVIMGWEDEEKVANTLFTLTTSPKMQQLADIVSDMRPEQLDKVIDYADYIKTKDDT